VTGHLPGWAFLLVVPTKLCKISVLHCNLRFQLMITNHFLCWRHHFPHLWCLHNSWQDLETQAAWSYYLSHCV